MLDSLFATISEKLQVMGIVEKSAMMVVYAMVANNLTYAEARDFYADYIGSTREKVQSGLCYATLRAGFDGMPAQILTELAKEVREIENGVSAGEGSGLGSCCADPGKSFGDENCSAYGSPDK